MIVNCLSSYLHGDHIVRRARAIDPFGPRVLDARVRLRLPPRGAAPVPRLGAVENKLDALKAKGQIHPLPVDPLHAPFLVLGVGVV